MKKRILAILSVLAISLCCVLAACQSEKDLTLSGYDKDGLELIEYDKAYAPFWEGTTVYNESCVFIKGEDGKITLKTMFTPTKVIAVRDSTLEITYKEGTDYTYRDGVFTLTENSSIPYFTYNQAHYNVGKGRHDAYRRGARGSHGYRHSDLRSHAHGGRSHRHAPGLHHL